MQNLPLAQYSPGLVVVTFQFNLMFGFGKDIFVSADQDEDGFMLSVGVDGNAALAQNLNEAGTIKMTFFHTSPANDILAASYVRHRRTGIVQGPTTIKDLRGRLLIDATNSWVKRMPTAQRGKEIQEVEWEIATDRLIKFPGGS